MATTNLACARAPNTALTSRLRDGRATGGTASAGIGACMSAAFFPDDISLRATPKSAASIDLASRAEPTPPVCRLHTVEDNGGQGVDVGATWRLTTPSLVSTWIRV